MRRTIATAVLAAAVGAATLAAQNAEAATLQASTCPCSCLAKEIKVHHYRLHLHFPYFDNSPRQIFPIHPGIPEVPLRNFQ